jgi:sugar phosphate isomerase/epimerase
MNPSPMLIGICAAPQEITPSMYLSFDYIEGHVQELLLPEQSDFEFELNRTLTRACRRSTIAANCLLPANLKVTGPSVDYGRLIRYAEVAFARAKALGIQTIVFGSAGARMIPDGWSAIRGFEQYVDALNRLAPIAEKQGITIVVEALNYGECNLINTLDEGAEAVRRCNHPHVRLLADLFHMLRNNEGPDALLRHAALITHSHLAENKERAQPGVYGDDFRPFFRALAKAERCRALTIECVWQGSMYEQVDPSVAQVRKQLSEAGL